MYNTFSVAYNEGIVMLILIRIVTLETKRQTTALKK